MKPFSVLAGYRSKIAGIIISLGGLILTLAEKLTHSISVFPKLGMDQHLELFLWISFVGFYLVAFSKEKNDDERVSIIRGKSMQIAFGATISTLIAFLLITVIDPTMQIDAGVIFIVVGFGLGFYLLHFNVGLYFDNAWDYMEDKTILGSMRQKKLVLLIYLVAAIILVLALKYL